MREIVFNARVVIGNVTLRGPVEVAQGCYEIPRCPRVSG